MKVENELKISATHNHMLDAVEFYLHTDNSVCTKIEMKTIENMQTLAYIPEFEPIRLSSAMAQRLLDQLWNIGLRPHNNKYGDEVVKTMSNHLSDMRKIAFKFLKLEEK